MLLKSSKLLSVNLPFFKEIRKVDEKEKGIIKMRRKWMRRERSCRRHVLKM